MKFLSRSLLALLAVLLLLPGSVRAAEPRSAETVAVPVDQVLADDLYAAGQSIRIAGTVNGDVVAAGSDITISGTVNGNVWVAGSTVTITGTVNGSVRSASGDLAITGTVRNDVVAGSSTFTLGKAGRVGRDVWIANGQTDLRGSVGRNLKAASSQITLAGPVNGDASIRAAEQLTIAKGADLRGKLTYHSNREANRDPAAKIAGPVEFTKQQPKSFGSRYADRLSQEFYWFLAAIILLLAILLYARKAARRGAEIIGTRPGWSLLAGLGFVVLGPVAMFVLLLTLVGIPLSIILAGVYVLILYTAKIFVALAVGGAILRRKPTDFLVTLGGGILGLAIYYVLAALPGVGPAVSAATILFGTGAQLILLREVYAHNRKKFGV